MVAIKEREREREREYLTVLASFARREREKEMGRSRLAWLDDGDGGAEGELKKKTNIYHT